MTNPAYEVCGICCLILLWDSIGLTMNERLLQIARCNTIADVKECMKVLFGLYVNFNKVLVSKKNVSARDSDSVVMMHTPQKSHLNNDCKVMVAYGFMLTSWYRVQMPSFEITSTTSVCCEAERATKAGWGSVGARPCKVMKEPRLSIGLICELRVFTKTNPQIARQV